MTLNVLRHFRPVRRESRAVARRRRRCVVSVVAIAGYVAISVTPAAAADAPPAAPAALTLASQSPWIADPGTFAISLHVQSALAPANLAVEFELYSKLASRASFEAGTSSTALPSESCIAKSPLVPLGVPDATTTDATAPFTIPFARSAESPSCFTPTPTFAVCPTTAQSACNNDYPLAVSLIDRTTGAVLRTLTTHVIVANKVAGSPALKVSLIAELGATTNLAPNGSPKLARSVSAIRSEVDVLANTRTRLSVALYPGLLLALARSRARGSGALVTATNKLVSHGRTGARVEMLTTPFANIDAAALVANGLGGEVENAVAAGRSSLAGHFGHAVPPAPYVTTTPLSQQGLSELQRSCLSEVVVPAGSVATTATRGSTTAPLIVGSALGTSTSCTTAQQAPEAFVADATLNAELSSTSSDPVLAGENVLADLAQIYFEFPFLTGARGVVAIAPDDVNPRLLQVVLDGLHSNPILSSTQLSNLFATVPTGSNGSPATAKLIGTSGGDAPSATAVAGAKRAVHAVKVTMPNNHSLLSSLNNSVIVAESAGMSPKVRQQYLAAPATALVKTIGGAISFSGSDQVTLTSQRGKVPITIQSGIKQYGPIHVLVHFTSNQLVLSTTTFNAVELSSKDTDDTITVGTHTSGKFNFDVTVYSATGGYLLAHRKVTVRSTAVSGEAIALSVAALLVLLAWWLRSIVRTRKKKAAESGAT